MPRLDGMVSAMDPALTWTNRQVVLEIRCSVPARRNADMFGSGCTCQYSRTSEATSVGCSLTVHVGGATCTPNSLSCG
jgi:hypothetical protein